MATLAAAEQLYDALYTWNQQGYITVTSTSLAFFQDMDPSIAPGTYSSSTSTYTTLYNAVQTYADGYLNVVATYTPSNGSLAEEFSSTTGAPLSAYDLTWSYAALLTCVAARNGVMPASWGEPSAISVPAICSPTSATGPYSTATNTNWPLSEIAISGATTNIAMPASCTTATSVAVTFDEIVTTTYGEAIKVVGDVGALGNWDTNNAVALSAIDYTSSNNLWLGTISFAAGIIIEYKYINVASNGAVTWEADPKYSTPVARFVQC